jgi:hypothetical protein
MSASREESASLQLSGPALNQPSRRPPEKTLVRRVLLDVGSVALFRGVGMMFMLYRHRFPIKLFIFVVSPVPRLSSDNSQ